MKIRSVIITAGIIGGVLTSLSTQAGGLLSFDFKDAVFSDPTTLDNPVWPTLPAGVINRTSQYVGEGEDECTLNEVSATAGDTYMLTGGAYAGLVTQVVVDKEWLVEDCGQEPTDDDLGELTFDWYMQDDNQNIWYMGEASRDFEDGCPLISQVPLGTAREDWPSEEIFLECTGGSWEAGQPGQEEGEIIGEAGVVVPGEFPFGGDAEALSSGNYYMQEVAENAEDMAKVLKIKAKVSVDEGSFAGDYNGCRTVKEWSPFDPGVTVEHKHYCEDVGLILIEGIGGGQTEVEVLVSRTDS